MADGAMEVGEVWACGVIWCNSVESSCNGTWGLARGDLAGRFQRVADNGDGKTAKHKKTNRTAKVCSEASLYFSLTRLG